MYHYTIQIQHKGGLYRLGTVVDPGEKLFLLERVNYVEGLTLNFSSDTGSINYLDHQDTLACCGPYYANAQISIYEGNALQAIESYVSDISALEGMMIEELFIKGCLLKKSDFPAHLQDYVDWQTKPD